MCRILPPSKNSYGPGIYSILLGYLCISIHSLCICYLCIFGGGGRGWLGWENNGIYSLLLLAIFWEFLLKLFFQPEKWYKMGSSEAGNGNGMILNAYYVHNQSQNTIYIDFWPIQGLPEAIFWVFLWKLIFLPLKILDEFYWSRKWWFYDIKCLLCPQSIPKYHLYWVLSNLEPSRSDNLSIFMKIDIYIGRASCRERVC